MDRADSGRAPGAVTPTHVDYVVNYLPLACGRCGVLPGQECSVDGSPGEPHRGRLLQAAMLDPFGLYAATIRARVERATQDGAR